MKAFKRFSAAREAAGSNPILRVGDLYIVGITVEDGYGCDISLISDKGTVTGSITARHLDRLGNANHAEAKRPYSEHIWPQPQEKRTVYRYQFCLRPFLSAAPKGFIDSTGKDINVVRAGYYGSICYPAKLDQETVDSYGLKFVGEEILSTGAQQ